MSESLTFVKGMMQFFNMTASQMIAEMKNLSKEDKLWFWNELKKIGIVTLEPGVSA